VISALTTGFGAATIGFDLDVDPRRRRGEPDFYGYVPDSAMRRTLLFGCMIAIGALLLLARSMSTAVLALLDSRYVAYYYVGDMGLYLAYKLLRHDLWHWIPLEGRQAVVAASMVRIAFKVLVDHTACFHFRSPTDLGGLFFTVNLVRFVWGAHTVLRSR
jgi:hypothetical protein